MTEESRVSRTPETAKRWVVGSESLGIVHDEETEEAADEWRFTEGARRYPGVRLDLMEMGMEAPQ